MAAPIAIILAAGKGTRMKSSLVKVLHPVAGKPMVSWVIDMVRAAGVHDAIVVAGHQSERVQESLRDDHNLQVVLQEEQLGTGHAVRIAIPYIPDGSEQVLILCGDTPLLRQETLKALLESHARSQAAITVLTAQFDDPTGYGRVVRDADGYVRAIVEHKDADEATRAITEINSGIYCMDRSFLSKHIQELRAENAQKEYYLTDLVGIAASNGYRCAAVCCVDREETLGINDREQLATAAAVLRMRINRAHMQSGVTLVDPAHTYVDASVVIGQDTVVYPGAFLSGTTTIGAGCTIEPNVQIADSTLGNNVHIKMGSVVQESVCDADVCVGPMAHLRPKSHLHRQVKIGNFVETKNVEIGEGSKASHLTYLGDARIGSEVNVGCGTITCNYDGLKKHTTVIGDKVFVGSDVQLVAPVTIGDNVIIAAGTTVTKDAPAGSLVIARVPQVNKEGWKRKQ